MKNIFRETLVHWRTHHAQRMGAALAYYAMLSFVPLLFLLVTIAGYLFSIELVQGTLMIELTKTLGTSVAGYIDQAVRSVSIQQFSFTATAVSVGIILLGAVGVFAELEQDFKILWDTPIQPFKHKQTLLQHIWAVVYKKIITFSFVPFLALILILVLGLSALLSVLEIYMGVIQFVTPVVFGTILFAVVYRLLPARTLPWRVLLLGGVVTTVLFMLGNTLILKYIKLLVHTDLFGPAASFVGLLVWTYYSAQVFFLGASFTYVYARRRKLIPSRD